MITFLLLAMTKQDNSLYELKVQIFGQNYLPLVPIYFEYYSDIPNYMLLDINTNISWVFKADSQDNKNTKEIIKYEFYTIIGNKNKGIIYVNSETEINEFNYLEINQITGENINIYPGVLSLNKNINEYNIVDKLTYEDEIIKSKYFGFCLDFTNRKNNEAQLFIGSLYNLNTKISNLLRLPLYQEIDEEQNEKNEKINYSKWAIKLEGIFIGSINTTLTKNMTIKNENEGEKVIYHINRKYNKGLIIDESAYIETIYNSIYVTKEAMLFLMENYFKDKKNICFRQDNKDEKNYEIKYHCLKDKKNLLKNISLVLENNITIQLTHDDLLNCAINHGMDNGDSPSASDTCEFNIKYHQKISRYVLGLSVFKKFKTYFLFNDNSVLLEGDKFMNSYLEADIFSNISRSKKRTISQTIKELFSTTICISFIFGLLAGAFYIYEKIFGKVQYEKDERQKIINKDKYDSL